MVVRGAHPLRQNGPIAAVLLARRASGPRQRLGCGEGFFVVEERLAHLEPTLDLSARESSAASEFHKSLIGGLIHRALSTGAKQIRERNLQRLRDPDQGFVARASSSPLQERCKAHRD